MRVPILHRIATFLDNPFQPSDRFAILAAPRGRVTLLLPAAPCLPYHTNDTGFGSNQSQSVPRPAQRSRCLGCSLKGETSSGTPHSVHQHTPGCPSEKGGPE